MLTSALHAIVARPHVYNRVQILAGATYIRRRLAPYLTDLTGTVLDVGAGTGTARSLLPHATYLWLDIDRQKLTGASIDGAMLGSATAIPLGDQSVDNGLCVAVSHHLADHELPMLVTEMARVVRRRVVFLDATTGRRLLWRYDRGSHPRTTETLRAALAARFELEVWETFAVYHRYVLAVGVARA